MAGSLISVNTVWSSAPTVTWHFHFSVSRLNLRCLHSVEAWARARGRDDIHTSVLSGPLLQISLFGYSDSSCIFHSYALPILHSWAEELGHWTRELSGPVCTHCCSVMKSVNAGNSLPWKGLATQIHFVLRPSNFFWCLMAPSFPRHLALKMPVTNSLPRIKQGVKSALPFELLPHPR
jgi:hypothetical protein